MFAGEVDEALLSWCRKQAEQGLWSTLGLDLTQTLDGDDSQAVLDDLAVDFCRLFVTSGGPGSPHESVHVNAQGANADPGLLFGDAAVAVRKLYREAGLELDEGERSLPDALGVELEFMERLCAMEVRATQDGLTDEVVRLRGFQRRMLEDHLGRWAPEYARKLQPQAETDFYRAMFDLMSEFVEWDLQQSP